MALRGLSTSQPPPLLLAELRSFAILQASLAAQDPQHAVSTALLREPTPLPSRVQVDRSLTPQMSPSQSRSQHHPTLASHPILHTYPPIRQHPPRLPSLLLLQTVSPAPQR